MLINEELFLEQRDFEQIQGNQQVADEPIPGPSRMNQGGGAPPSNDEEEEEEERDQGRRRSLSSTTSSSESLNFMEANDNNLRDLNIQQLTVGPYEQGQVIYNDQTLKLKIKKIQHRRETNYLEDHLFEISVNEINRSQRPPLLISLLMIFRTALIQILQDLAQFYDEQNNHQMYVTVIDDSINHGLNTGNYNVRADPELVTNRILTMLYNFLTSHMSLRLNQSFRFNIKVLSLRHANDRVQRGGFNPHLLNGSFSINKKKYLFYLPEGFEGSENVFAQNCLLISIILGHYLNKSLEFNGQNFCRTVYKCFSNINSKDIREQKKAGLAILDEVSRVCFENKIIDQMGPHSLDELAPKLTNYFDCQLIVFNNLISEKISYIYPPSFDDSKRTIFLFQEINCEGKSHVSLIDRLKYFQRLNFIICFYCEKVFKSRSKIFYLHKCQKTKTCNSCNRFLVKENTYLNKENFQNYCLQENENLSCPKCLKTMNNKGCLKYHKCSEFFCEKCQLSIKRRVKLSLEETKRLHKCFQKFCFICKSFTNSAILHTCTLQKTEIDKYQPALGFFNFQIVNSNNSSCYECFQNKDLLRSEMELDWEEFIKLEAIDNEIKKKYQCPNHLQIIPNDDPFVNLCVLKLETQERGIFETMTFFEEEMNDLKNQEKFNIEKHLYSSIPIYKGKIIKRFGKSINATNICQQNITNLQTKANKNPVEQLICKLFEFKNSTLICFGVEHLLFVYKCFIEFGIECRPLISGQNVLQLEVELFSLRFINLQNYFKVPMFDLIDLFNLDLKRIYFPEVLNCRENYNMISLTPREIPLEFYLNFNDSLKEKENKNNFIETNFDQCEEWSFQTTLFNYCLFQVNVIMLASLKFVSNCEELQKLLSSTVFKDGIFIQGLTLPFAKNFCTISGFIFSLFKIYFVDPGRKLFIVKNEFPKKIQSSKEEMEFAAYLQFVNPGKKYNNVFSARCERNFKRAIADILCYDDNEIFFFNECCCHGHDPRLCSITSRKKSQKFFGRPFEDLRKEFEEKLNYVSLNYSYLKITVIWQCQWRSMKKIDEDVKEFLKTYIPWPSHHISPREAVRGARIESFALRWKQEENTDEKLYYVDCSSLYPYMG